MNPVFNPTLQNLGSGDELALALKEFSGMVMAAFPEKAVFLRYGLKKTITSGSSHQFPATWKMSAEDHEPGTELPGNNEPVSEERLINTDVKEIVAHTWVNVIQEFIQHFSTRQERAFQAAQAIARVLDSRLARCLINGARVGVRGTVPDQFPAGNVLASKRVGPIGAATAYPISLIGSQRLQEDFAEIAQRMDEKEVPKEGRVAFVTPYIGRVLRQDHTLLSRDYQATNDKLTRKMVVVEGFMLEETLYMPAANVTTEANANYNGDFSKVVCAFSGHPTATGTVMFQGISPFGPTWHDDRRAWLVGAAALQGSKWLRPEACGVIELA